MEKNKKIKTFIIILGILYFLFLFGGETFHIFVGLVCPNGLHHNVPNVFIGSHYGQICATNSELRVWYILTFFLYLILPILIIYLLLKFIGKKYSKK